MALQLAEQYYVKAMEQYPYALEEVIENLNYALSYDPEHAGANCLMGKFYQYQFHDYVTAEDYYEQALSCEPQHVDTCLAYFDLLLNTRRLKQAQKLLSMMSNIPGICRALILRNSGFVAEYGYKYKEAIAFFKAAKLESFNDGYLWTLKEDIARVKQKQKQNRTKKKSKKGKKKTKPQSYKVQVNYVATVSEYR